jgi:hypothetical protein
MKRNERKIAVREGEKNIKPLPDTKALISLDRKFTKEEFEKISFGLIPLGMDEKWFIFLENNILYFHRSWTGSCIYQVQFVLRDDFYIASEIWVNRDPNQYKETKKQYDEKLLLFLIENLLLGNNTPFPIPNDIPKDYPKGAFQHSVSGTGYPEIEIEKEN